MKRDYRQAIEARGIPARSETRPAFTLACRAWREMTPSRRAEFLQWVENVQGEHRGDEEGGAKR